MLRSTRSGGSTNCFRTIKPDSEWSQVNRRAAGEAGEDFAGACSSFLRLRGVQPARAKGRSISRWAR